MKFARVLLLAAVICAVASAALERETKKKWLKAAKSVAHLNKRVDSVSSKYARGLLRKKRGLQDDGLPNIIDEQCGGLINEYEAVTPEQIAAALECVKNIVVGAFNKCYKNFPGVRAPAVCLIDLGLSSSTFEGIANSESEYEVPNSTEYELGSDSEGSDENSEAAFVPIEGIDTATCTSLFGTAADPKAAACLGLLDTDDIERYFAALANNFADYAQDCADHIALTGGAPLEYEIGTLPIPGGTEESDQATIDAQLAGFNQNFATCDKKLKIKGALEDAYGASSIVSYSVAMSVVLAFANLVLA